MFRSITKLYCPTKLMLCFVSIQKQPNTSCDFIKTKVICIILLVLIKKLVKLRKMIREYYFCTSLVARQRDVTVAEYLLRKNV